MKGGMNQILKQAQKMQEELGRVQAELANITVGLCWRRDGESDRKLSKPDCRSKD